MSDPTKPVINHLPAPVIVFVLILTLGEFYITGAEARFWGSSESRIALIRQVAFLPEVFQRSLLAGSWVPELFLRLITYPFVHSSLLQAVFAGVLTLTLGKFLAGVLGSFAIILIFFSSSMFAALGYSFFTNDSFPLFGSFPAAYGLIGAFTFVLFGRSNGSLNQQLQAFRLLSILMFINIIFAFFQNGPALWVAELSAVVMGFVCTAFLYPSGISVIIKKLKDRRH